ncbi:MAG: DUF3376 domain-containing protein [Ilumatobacteraceae bacterium]
MRSAAPTVPGAPVDPDVTAQLRLAISMRGGVSLAVWIGGALAEIDVLRRSCPTNGVTASTDPNAPIYKLLLKLAGYTSVQVDVLSGASAGGLNGAIYAASLMYDLDFRVMLPIWVRLADIESMIRIRTKDAETGQPVDSLLEGDEYFLAKLVTELGDLTVRAEPRPYPDVSFLDLVLTGTLVSPAEEIVVGAPGENMAIGRRASFFQFHHERNGGPDGAATSHFPPRPDERIVQQLALAGRASASFPFAFEPATVETDHEPPDDQTTDMATVFSERGAPHAFRVMDGGVLDNIPIARAIRAVAESPAADPTDRWLLYLYPSPPDDLPSAPPPPEAPVRALSTVRRALTAKLGTETILDDTAALDQHNGEAAFQAMRWRGLWDGAGPDVGERWAQWLAALGEPATVVEIRARMDADRLLDVLDRPRRRYAGRPDLVDDPGSPLDDFVRAGGAGADRVAEAIRIGLPAALERVYRGAPEPFAEDAVTVRSALDLLIGGCRAVEAGRGPATPKRRLYDHRAAVEHTLFASELALISALRDDPPGDVDGVTGWLDGHLPVVGVEGPVLAGMVAALDDLGPIVATLPDHPMTRPYRMLAQVDLAGLLRMARHTVSMLATTLQNPSSLTLKVISGAAPTPLAADLAMYRTPRGDRQQPGTDRIYVDDKLAGNTLGNFAAFLKADWRVNDWTWGRADSASRLAEALVARLDHRREGTAEDLEALWRLVGDPADAAFGRELVAALAAGPAVAEREKLWWHVVRTLQLELWRHHLPLIDSIDSRSEEHWSPRSAVVPPPPEKDGEPPVVETAPLTPAQAVERLATYAIGRETVRDIRGPERRRIAMRLAKVGFAALLPARTYASPEPDPGSVEGARVRRQRRAARLGRGVLWPLRPIVLGVVFLVAAPKQAVMLLAMATVAVAFGWWGVDLVGWAWPRYLVPGIPAAVLVAAGVAWMATVAGGRKVGIGLIAAGAGLAALAVVIDRLPADSALRWPGWIGISGVVFAAVGTAWMRPFHRVVSVAIAVAVYGGTAVGLWAWSSPPGSLWALERPFPAGWWTVVCIVLTAIALGIQVDHGQVFSRRAGRPD